MKKMTIVTVAVLMSLGHSCNTKTEFTKVDMKTDKNELNAIFPKGQKGSEEYFTGNVFHIGLVDADSSHTTAVGNIYFEPGARSNWHLHPSGQILIITDGVGYHQMEGQPIKTIKKGDVVKCPPNVRHWHGASPDVGLQQLYIIPNTEQGIVEWQEAVSVEQYSNHKK